MYLGDNVLLEGMTRFVEGFERHRPDAQIFLARCPSPNSSASRCSRATA